MPLPSRLIAPLPPPSRLPRSGERRIPPTRDQVLRRLARALEQRAEEFARLDCLEPAARGAGDGYARVIGAQISHERDDRSPAASPPRAADRLSRPRLAADRPEPKRGLPKTTLGDRPAMRPRAADPRSAARPPRLLRLASEAGEPLRKGWRIIWPPVGILVGP
jgi:hypothetical protein